MKRFLTVLITFVLILATLTFAVNALYLYQQNQIADTMSPMRSSDAVIRNVPEGIEVACFGSSHALLGLDFEDFDQDYVCFNFGQASQFLSYDDRLLQYYLDHFKPGATVLIAISHFSLFGKPDTEYDNFAALKKALTTSLENDVEKTSLIKIVLKGERNAYLDIDKQGLELYLNSVYFFVKVYDKTEIKIDINDFAQDKTLRGEFLREVLKSDMNNLTKSRVITCGINALKGEDF